MSEQEPNDYHYTKEELQIPQEFKVSPDFINGAASAPEKRESIPRLSSVPFRIAQRIREIQEELKNPTVRPGAERTMELKEEYARLKDQRLDFKERFLEIAKNNNATIDYYLELVKERMNIEKTELKEAQRDKDHQKQIETKRTLQSCNDFIRLFETDDTVLEKMRLDDEDPGLEAEMFRE